MRQFLNQYSFIAVALVLLAAAWLGLRRLHGVKRYIALGLVVVVLAGAATLLRSDPGVSSHTDFDRALAKGRPVALEFYSNF